MKGMLPIVERHLLGLAEPAHEQTLGGTIIVLAQQGFNHDGEGLGRPKRFRLTLPEGKVGRSFRARAPALQGRRHALRRLRGFRSMHAGHLADLYTGELVPPAGQPPQALPDRRYQRPFARSRRFTQEVTVEAELAGHDPDQLVNARVVNRIFARRRKRKESLKTEDVPWICECATGDASAEPVLRLRKQ